MGRGRRTAAVLVAAVLGLTGCTHDRAQPAAGSRLEQHPSWAYVPASPSPVRTAAPGRVAAYAVSPAALVPFSTCGDLVARMRREALRQVTAYGLPYADAPVAVMGFGPASSPGMAAPVPAAAAGSPGSTDGAPTAFSPTNDQETGVDEPDLVKTDGRLLAVVRQSLPAVQVVDLSGDRPRLRGTFRLSPDASDAQLLLVHGRLVVLSRGTARRQDGFRPTTDVAVLSLADPGRPRLERTFEVTGSLVAARELAGRVVVVTQSIPTISWVAPQDGTARGTARALARNRYLVRHAPLRAWLPSVTSSRTGHTYRPACDAALRPQAESGTATTSVLSLDPASDVPGRQLVVEGSGAAVYASTRSLYVTTIPWQAQSWAMMPGTEVDATTSIHRFDLSDPAAPAYAGSGSVPGSLIGQYALSEYGGLLRVASTVGATSWELPGGKAPRSDSRVTVLRPEADRLVVVGRVGGLGRGERIYGVRFVGDLGYVVTFRQVDPLYVVDLSDPRRPRVRGSLHVTGFSSYLHPLGGSLLLGIGQEVQQGHPEGSQVSVFDVSDPTSPSLRSRQVFPNAWSGAESDPHQVLWWPSTRLLVVPLSQSPPPGAPDGGVFNGVVAMRMDGTGALHEVGRLQPPSTQSPQMCCWDGILRSVVVGDELLTLSDSGVMASSVETLKERAWLPYR